MSAGKWATAMCKISPIEHTHEFVSLPLIAPTMLELLATNVSFSKIVTMATEMTILTNFLGRDFCTSHLSHEFEPILHFSQELKTEKLPSWQ